MKRFIVTALCLGAGLLLLVFVAGAAGTDGARPAGSPPAAAAPAPGGYVFQGCWAYFASGPCYDIYRDGDGAYWICLRCGATKKPGPGQCKRITLDELNRGYWCS